MRKGRWAHANVKLHFFNKGIVCTVNYNRLCQTDVFRVTLLGALHLCSHATVTLSPLVGGTGQYIRKFSNRGATLYRGAPPSGFLDVFGHISAKNCPIFIL